ncbi:tetratricopeptide repeat protein [Nocardia sp. NBC_00416]|uniref:tetratricopeptide repeat protein n=1 Tax=Nocardia sp. NBC_00416 TaxID=2975991 RepID=UPI002E1B3D92
MTGNQIHGGVTFMVSGDRARPVAPPPPEAWQPIAEVDAPPGLDNLPVIPGRGFVGRERELDELDAGLADLGRVAVHGLGGIGKSTLVAHWAATRPHGHAPVRWITADTAAHVEQGLAEFAAALQPAWAQALAVEQLAERALQWLATHTGWLLILDNVDDPADTAEVLARAGAGRIVITSRLSAGWQQGTSVVRLDVLEPDESLRLITGILTAAGPRNEDGAAELCAELGHLPLAVGQAGAYLAQNPLTTARAYLLLLTEYPADMFGQTAVGVDPARAIARIWRVTLDRIVAVQPAAGDLLRVLAWFGSDAVPFALCGDLAAPPVLNAALGVLNAYNMISADPVIATVSIHRLVQAVARTPDSEDPHRSPGAIEQARTHAATTLLGSLPDPEDSATWPTWRILLPHIDALLEYTVRDTTTTAHILDATASFLTGQGLTKRAAAYHHRAFTHCERVLGPDHFDTLASGNNLANAYQATGRVREAIPLHERILADFARVLGPDHPDTLTSGNNLAQAYKAEGRVGEAISLHERVLADFVRVLGPDHPGSSTSAGNLANAYQAAGRLGEAISLHERVLADRARTLGPDHPDTLGSRSDLAQAYQAAGRLGEAISLHERVVADRARVLGPDHPDAMASGNNLANAYQAVGRASEAIPIYERNLVDCQRILGPDHPHTLVSRNNLANAYELAGRLSEAISMYERNLADRERILGSDHPLTWSSRVRLRRLR